MHAQILIHDLERRIREERWAGVTRDEAKRLSEHVKTLELALADMLRLVRGQTRPEKSA
jgi:hypothetical protein